MRKSNSPRFSELLDWLEGQLPADEAQAIAERLQMADQTTQADLAWLRAFLQAHQAIKLASPPPSVREVLKRRFAARAEAQQPPGLFRRWLATLIFDSRPNFGQLAMAGLRSAATEGLQRQLIYTTEVAEIALNIHPQPREQRLSVTGQVFPTTDTPADAFSIQLLRDASEASLASTDDLGEFAFNALPAGEYELIVSAGQFEVVIPAIQLQL
jgi:hypothetical protein